MLQTHLDECYHIGSGKEPRKLPRYFAGWARFRSRSLIGFVNDFQQPWREATFEISDIQLQINNAAYKMSLNVYDSMLIDSLRVCDMLQTHLDECITSVRAKSPENCHDTSQSSGFRFLYRLSTTLVDHIAINGDQITRIFA
ncbi:hypothetical protein OSTOST_01551 [Ostertagia ostertagi]